MQSVYLQLSKTDTITSRNTLSKTDTITSRKELTERDNLSLAYII